MLFFVTAALALFVGFVPAQAHDLQHKSYTAAQSVSLVTVQSAAGPITVAKSLSQRFKALIADFAAHGYKPRNVGCYASSGHVTHSRHYHGGACDFDQTGWGKTAKFMHHAGAIIHKYGFRDGCDFGDCGHVDDGVSHGGSYRTMFVRGEMPAENQTHHHMDSNVDG